MILQGVLAVSVSLLRGCAEQLQSDDVASAVGADVVRTDHPPALAPAHHQPQEGTQTMKRIAALFAAVVFALAVVACDDGGDATEAPADSPAAEEPAE
jgi:hypothetical protein